MGTDSKNEEIADLPDILRMVRSDTKLIVGDLLDGVNLWSHTSFLVMMIGLLGMLIGILTLGRGTLVPPTGLYYYAEIIASFGLGIVGLVASLFYQRRYSRLKKKYHSLFEAAKKL